MLGPGFAPRSTFEHYEALTDSARPFKFWSFILRDRDRGGSCTLLSLDDIHSGTGSGVR